MTETFLEAMESWLGEIKHRLLQHWWGFPVVVLILLTYGTLEHRFYFAINAYIDTHWPASIASVLGVVWVRALIVTFFVIVAPILGIVVHAYIVTRRTDDLIAEFIQKELVPSEWASPMAMQAMELAGVHDQTFSFDLICEIYVVNSKSDITVRSICAEAQIDGENWTVLDQIRDLGDYELVIEKREPGVAGGYRIKQTRKTLDDFMSEISNGLRTRIGYRGFVRFRLKATKRQAEGTIPIRLRIIDAFGNAHNVKESSIKTIEPTEGKLSYSLRNLGA